MSKKNISVEITVSQKDKAEIQIETEQVFVDYDTKEYPVETVVDKYLKDMDEDKNELFVPDYQRDFSWDEKRQSKFIESIIIGLPIPYIFVADVKDKDGRLEIVDGSQRIRTLAAFMRNELKLVNLKKLTELNGFQYSDLPLSRQRRFNRKTLRMIELTDKANEEARRDIFERINTGSLELEAMEKRRGIQPGPFTDFLSECAGIPLFKTLAPLTEVSENRRDREELVLRFFSYLNKHQKFKGLVRDFLDEYLTETQKAFNDKHNKTMRKEFELVLNFVEKYFPDGFKRGPKDTLTPRVRFEAIAIGVALALRENNRLVPDKASIEVWLKSPEFKKHTTSDASNGKSKLIGRIEFVRDQLLKNAI
jgi:uncharacterized protein with ParB-like and HNH nuclease domain